MFIVGRFVVIFSLCASDTKSLKCNNIVCLCTRIIFFYLFVIYARTFYRRDGGETSLVFYRSQTDEIAVTRAPKIDIKLLNYIMFFFLRNFFFPSPMFPTRFSYTSVITYNNILYERRPIVSRAFCIAYRALVINSQYSIYFIFIYCNPKDIFKNPFHLL